MRKKEKRIYIFFIIVLAAVIAAFGFYISSINKDLTEAQKTITQSESGIDEKDKRIADLEKQLENSKSENQKIKSELDAAKAEKDKLQKENGTLKKEIETLKLKKQQAAQEAVKKPSVQTTPPATTTKPTTPSSANKVCYLTFDDGPSQRTLEILKILKKYNVKATFFVINTENFNYVKQIHNDGHAIGLHAYDHNYANIYKSTTAYFNDLEKLSNKINSAIGIKPTVIRFPGGSSNVISKNYCKGIMSTLAKQVVQKGYAYFDWNVDSDDAGSSHSSYTKIVNNVLNGANGKNSICVLMHDAQAKTSTVQALPKIIEGLTARGFKFATLSNKVTGFKHGISN